MSVCLQALNLYSKLFISTRFCSSCCFFSGHISVIKEDKDATLTKKKKKKKDVFFFYVLPDFIFLYLLQLAKDS